MGEVYTKNQSVLGKAENKLHMQWTIGHFRDDCFDNKVQWSMGMARCLYLKADAIPTIYPAGTCATSVPTVSSEQRPAARKRQVQEILNAADTLPSVEGEVPIPDEEAEGSSAELELLPVMPQIQVPLTKDVGTQWDPPELIIKNVTTQIPKGPATRDVEVQCQHKFIRLQRTSTPMKRRRLEDLSFEAKRPKLEDLAYIEDPSNTTYHPPVSEE